MGLIRFLHRYLVPQTMPSSAVGYYQRLIDGVAELYLRPVCDEVTAAFPGPARILDIGTGTGQLPVMLARANADYEITAIDLSDACLEAARERARDQGVEGRVRFARADAESGLGEQGSFDLVISTCSMHHWRRPGRVLASAAQRLRPNGQIWIVDDAAEATAADRRQWINDVQARFPAGRLFRAVYGFESRFLAYSHEEVRQIASSAGLCLTDWRMMRVLFVARMTRAIRSK